MPHQSAASGSGSGSGKIDRRRKAFRLDIIPVRRGDLIPQGPDVIQSSSATADALARLHQYDDSADGIGVVQLKHLDK